MLGVTVHEQVCSIWSSRPVLDLDRSVLVPAQRVKNDCKRGGRQVSDLGGSGRLYRRPCSVVRWYAGHHGTHGMKGQRDGGANTLSRGDRVWPEFYPGFKPGYETRIRVQ